MSAIDRRVFAAEVAVPAAGAAVAGTLGESAGGELAGVAACVAGASAGGDPVGASLSDPSGTVEMVLTAASVRERSASDTAGSLTVRGRAASRR
ncbi:hypothetical protein [Candidatus Poriferisodalis sp.]|uniref:hypothetical protein n=1 Tax=Candidatus Poriferisodalis sp. TaxID=3101277 RepID=UPI003B5B3F9E